MTDAAPAPVAQPVPAPAASAPKAEAPIGAPARRLTFYFSASHRAAFVHGRSLSYFKGQEFTQCCEVGVAPFPRKDLVTIGTGTEADVTVIKQE